MSAADARRGRVLIVESRYYPDIADGLIAGAVPMVEDAGYSIERLEVPGVFEIPAAIRHAAKSGAYAGFLAFGCVIRGETSHYDHICNEASRAIMDLTMQDGLALGFGVLTCENGDQAAVRADPNGKNKGAEAARACLAMIDVRHRFNEGGAP
ncbi:MAG: 6,7-dimethyl-8-ribityllumazine synthase [Rhodospirillales bacterium]